MRNNIFGINSPNFDQNTIAIVSPQYEHFNGYQALDYNPNFQQTGIPFWDFDANNDPLSCLSGLTFFESFDQDILHEQNLNHHSPTNLHSLLDSFQNISGEDQTQFHHTTDVSQHVEREETQPDLQIDNSCGDPDKLQEALDSIFEKSQPQRDYKPKRFEMKGRKKSPVEKVDEDDRKIKKDAVWKQFLRSFRHYFQQMFMENFGRGIDHWDDRRLLYETQRFIKLINLEMSSSPNKDDRDREMMGLIMILRTTVHKKPPPSLQKYISGLLPLYWKLFINNNNRQLEQFFKEELIRKLWQIYPLELQGEFLSKLNKKELRLIKKDFKKFDLRWPEF